MIGSVGKVNKEPKWDLMLSNLHEWKFLNLGDFQVPQFSLQCRAQSSELYIEGLHVRAADQVLGICSTEK